MKQQIQAIAHIQTAFGSKFGVPRQSGIVDALEARIVFEPTYRVAEAIRGLESFSHIWLIWSFSEVHQEKWSPTVRPPMLGGNVRMGVFATRSPFRPNALGLSSVRLLSIDWDCEDAPVLIVAGADLMNNTPIFDIKPYLPFTDSHPDAVGGFTEKVLKTEKALNVVIPEHYEGIFSTEQLNALRQVLSHDPRPHYQQDGERIYGMEFWGVNVQFRVADDTVTVL
ncbi:MAG: tRNA (N6-threonylcarbamoyladenosine(37)-N6)-methyltransferase TrmO [Bacteroidaceae bacterium]|nr:tRNA (N6-threonylcarbamoyladenosine(37)-N6)-methyltransferase TrmO [Bacteroidaceae bacterium]MCF0186296.1 tRNA (N6-threonylcarbamoyladenosine(37)-N6)-methyltransferase TrmO [Bacteroidaceae bacterium]